MVTSVYQPIQRCLINTSKSDRLSALPNKYTLFLVHCPITSAEPRKHSTKRLPPGFRVCGYKEKNKQGSRPGTPLRPLQQDCGRLALESSLDSIGSPPSPLWLLACMHFHKLISPTSPSRPPPSSHHPPSRTLSPSIVSCGS